MSSHKLNVLILGLWIIVIYIQNNLVISQITTEDKTDTTTAARPKSLETLFREIRKNQTTKDADMVIKMTRDFVMDMQQKMNIIKRIERTYSSSGEYATGSVLNDITTRFEHMCNLYKQYATVRRYVFNVELDDKSQPSADIIPVFQLMLSDYNEILMQIEVFKLEMLSWAEIADISESRALIKKQMLKFGNLPAKLTPPQIREVVPIVGEEKGKENKKVETKKETGGKGRRWGYRMEMDYQQKWSGELDGVSLDER